MLPLIGPRRLVKGPRRSPKLVDEAYDKIESKCTSSIGITETYILDAVATADAADIAITVAGSSRSHTRTTTGMMARTRNSGNTNKKRDSKEEDGVNGASEHVERRANAEE
jgi:hypothetical protein